MLAIKSSNNYYNELLKKFKIKKIIYTNQHICYTTCNINNLDKNNIYIYLILVLKL
jgi:hypothetical protein